MGPCRGQRYPVYVVTAKYQENKTAYIFSGSELVFYRPCKKVQRKQSWKIIAAESFHKLFRAPKICGTSFPGPSNSWSGTIQCDLAL